MNEEKQTIYDLGFDKNLQKPISDFSSGVVYNAVDGALNAGQVISGGHLELKTLSIGGFTRMVASGDDIQNEIDSVVREGGGTLQFKAGTYEISKSIFGYSNIRFKGAKEGSTILSFIGPTNIQFNDTSVYSTGTITSVSGVNVTGSGTSWLANVTIDHQFFIAGKWYKIAAVTGDTTIVLSEGYTGGATFPGASYRISKPIKDIDFEELSFKNSTGTALTLTGVRNVTKNNCTFEDNNKGFIYNYVSEITIDGSLSVSNTSNGYEFNNCGFADIESLASIANGGNGGVLNNVRVFPMNFCATNANTGDGLSVTGAQDANLTIESSSNGGQGIELVSGNDNVIIEKCVINANTSDGIKLTASSNNCRMVDSNIKNNGGYGINIADSTSGSAIISLNYFNNNTSGSYQNLGTNTLIKVNQGATDYP